MIRAAMSLLGTRSVAGVDDAPGRVPFGVQGHEFVDLERPRSLAAPCQRLGDNWPAAADLAHSALAEDPERGTAVVVCAVDGAVALRRGLDDRLRDERVLAARRAREQVAFPRKPATPVRGVEVRRGHQRVWLEVPVEVGPQFLLPSAHRVQGYLIGRIVLPPAHAYLDRGQRVAQVPPAVALDQVARAEGVSRAELIRELIDRAIGGQPGTDLAADLAAIGGSFGILVGEEPFARGRDERMDYLGRLADA